MRGLALTILAVLAVGATAWALVPSGTPGFAGASVRVGVLVILGAGVLGASLHGAGGRRLLLELLAMVGGGCWVLSWLGDGTAAALAMSAWLIPWCWTLPLRCCGRPGLARMAFLGASGAMLATPWLVPRTWSDLPAWVLDWNPLARLHGSILSEDWFHGPTLYPRVGERYYAYPDAGDGLVIPLLTAAGAVMVAIALAGVRRRYAASAAIQA